MIGFTSGVTYLGISSALKGMKIDDPLDIVAVHLGGGLGQIAILLKTQIQIMHLTIMFKLINSILKVSLVCCLNHCLHTTKDFFGEERTLAAGDTLEFRF